MRPLALAAAAFLACAARAQTVGEVLANVREACGLGVLTRLPHGVRLTGDEEGHYGEQFAWECVTDGKRYFTARVGRFTEKEACDGRQAWIRELGGETRICELGDRATAAATVGIITGFLLAEGAPVQFCEEPERSTDQHIALITPFDEERTTLRVEIDRQTWRPTRWHVGAGLNNGYIDLQGEIELDGVRFPRTVVTGDARLTISAAETVADDNPARYTMTPSIPADYAFDVTIPSNLPARTDRAKRLQVRPLINGKDVGWFLLDTGSQLNLILPAAAEAAGLELFGQPLVRGLQYQNHPGRFCRADALSVGPLTIRDSLFIVATMKGEAEDMVGVLGFPVFARAVIELESDASRVGIFDPRSYKLPFGQWLPMQYENACPVVQGKMEDHPALFRLDTGAGGGATFDAPTVRAWQLLSRRSLTTQQGDELDGGSRFLMSNASRMWLGRHWADDVLIRLAQSSLGKYTDTYTNAHLGMFFGRAFVLVFDFQNRRFAAEPPALWHNQPEAPRE